jgi:hypothetical protein
LRKIVLALALVALLPACNDDEDTPESNGTTSASEPEATIAQVTVTATPTLVPAESTADPDLPWAISWQTQVTETGGIAATVTTIDVHLLDLVVSYSGPELSAASTTGSVALAARGNLTFNGNLFYALPDGARLAVVSVVVWLQDARGNTISQVAQFRIV